MQTSGSPEIRTTTRAQGPVRGVTTGIGVELLGIAIAVLGVAIGTQPYPNGVSFAALGVIVAILGLFLHEKNI